MLQNVPIFSFYRLQYLRYLGFLLNFHIFLVNFKWRNYGFCFYCVAVLLCPLQSWPVATPLGRAGGSHMSSLWTNHVDQPFWTTKDQLSPICTITDLLGPSWTILGHLRPAWTILDNLVKSCKVWSSLIQKGPKLLWDVTSCWISCMNWNLLETSVTPWNYSAWTYWANFMGQLMINSSM